MVDDNCYNRDIELVKLISFAYDLHKEGIVYYGKGTELFPRPFDYNNWSYNVKRLDEGIVWGTRRYESHSSSRVFTDLGLTVGKIVDNNFIFEYAISFSISNRDNKIYICLLNPDLKDKMKLVYKDGWDRLSLKKRKNLFLRSMVILGFNEEDVIKVIDGKMSAREAYMHIAPEEKKYVQWVNYGRRYFYFYNNVAIEGNYGLTIDFDSFPFPFEGEVVLDCSKVSTAAISLDKNTRPVRLINVNENVNSIRYANLRNAIIDEPIDLYLVDATGTTFGHQIVTNVSFSKAPLDGMNLSLACDEEGNRFKTDKSGYVSMDHSWNPKVVKTKKKSKGISVLANVDTLDSLAEAVDSKCDGIGLVRTETLFYTKENIDKFLKLFFSNYRNPELRKWFITEQKNLLRAIVLQNRGKRIVIRLFDFRLKDILRAHNLTDRNLASDFNKMLEGYRNVRGDYFLVLEEKLLLLQLSVILELCKEYDVSLDILIPYVTDYDIVKQIKVAIVEQNAAYGVSYRVGAMIENLYSVYNADRIAKNVDFVSIGLNDLTESVTGKSRDSGDSDFYYLTDEVKKAMEEAIYRIKASNSGISIGVCGEHTNYLENMEFFRSIGIDSISTIANNVVGIKRFLNGDKDYSLLKEKQE